MRRVRKVCMAFVRDGGTNLANYLSLIDVSNHNYIHISHATHHFLLLISSSFLKFNNVKTDSEY